MMLDYVEYYSLDSINKTYADINALEELSNTEFLNTIKSSGMSHHKLALKIATQ